MIHEEPQDWSLETINLYDAVEYLGSSYSIEEKAVLCGYYYELDNQKIPLIDQFQDEYERADDIIGEEGRSPEPYSVINNRLCWKHPDHGGCIYIAKKLLDQKGDDKEWDEFTIRYLIEEEFLDEDEAKEKFEECDFTEPMMIRYITCMRYIDTGEQVDDDDFFQSIGININDLHYQSDWING